MTHIRKIIDTTYTSDHVWRMIKTELYAGFTWNILEKCYTAKGSKWGHSNNPLDEEETGEEYAKRKRDQIEEITRLCSIDGVSFGCLQEADIMLDPVLSEELKTALKDVGFSVQFFEEKELVVLHSNRLVLTGTQELLKFVRWERSYTVLYLCEFDDSVTGQKVKIGSFHLDYKEDYTTSIPELMKTLSEDGSTVILGGDCNHPPGYGVEGLLVSDKDEVTNFYTNYSKCDDNGYTKVELHDERYNVPKAYDGFFSSVEGVVSGEHKWEKGALEDGREYPILVAI